MNKNDTINIIYGGDHFIFKGIFLSAISLLEHTSSKVKFHILTMSYPELNEHGLAINSDDIKLFENMIKEYNIDNSITLYDVTNEYNATLKKSKNKKSFYTPYCMTRLFCENLINADFAVYLDADTLVFKDITALFNEVDINDYELAAASDFLGRFWVRRDYFNSGVLFLNMNKIRETKLFTRSIEKLLVKKYFMADQSAINDLVKARQIMPRKFNEQRPLKKDTVIGHYVKHVFGWSKPLKPWDVKRMKKTSYYSKLKNIYDKYLKIF